VEQEFARKLDEREDIKLFLKLPEKFTIDTPVGKYIPDWAIVKHNDDTIYMVCETKGVRKEDYLKLRTSEADKINCGIKHFEALGVPFNMVTDAKEV
jgi:type III restriction enzyme